MKRLFFLIALLAAALPLRAQNSASGSITASTTTCAAPGTCVWESPLPFNASTSTINVSGTFSATLLVEESNNAGQTWATVATITTAGTTTYAVNGFTDIRVRCSAYVSGTAVVTINTGLQTGLQGPPGPAGSGGGITLVASLPGTCTPGVAPNGTVQLTVAPYLIYVCTATNTYTQVGGAVAALGATFGDSATGSALGTSEVRYITVPFACTIKGWHIMADAGTVTIKVARVNGGTALPTVASNSISTSGVSLSSGTKIDSTTVTDFTALTLSVNDTLGFFITTVATAKQVTFQLDCQ